MKKIVGISLVGVIAILGFFAYMLSVRMEMSTYYRNGIYKMNCTVGNTQNPPERIWICGEEQNFNIITFTGNDLTFQGTNSAGAVYIPIPTTGLHLQLFTEGTGNRILHTYVVYDFLGQKELKPSLDAFNITPSLHELSFQTQPNTSGANITFDPNASIRFDVEEKSEIFRNTFLDKGGTLEGVIIQFAGISGENVIIHSL